MKTALCVIGTRPEVIKMAPVVKMLKQCNINAPILATGQHRELLDQALRDFSLQSTWDIGAMRPNQGLSDLVARVLPEIENTIHLSHADIVIAQGDTATVFSAALAAFHAGVPFAHVEAGLRSGDLRSPFPEEGMRRLISGITTLHFAPTETAVAALLREGCNTTAISMVGNTVIDAILETSSRTDLPWPKDLKPPNQDDQLVLLTLHRREHFGEPLLRILSTIKKFASSRPNVRLVYPVHPNPNVRLPAEKLLGGIENIHLLNPLTYAELVSVMKVSYAIFTDSGGIQEEAPALGKPLVVFRNTTERPEVVDQGGAILVGDDPGAFTNAAACLWDDPAFYRQMAIKRLPYGDGNAADRIAEIIFHYLNGHAGH